MKKEATIANTFPAQTPDACLVGYYKGGTTYLRGYFSHHPDLCWSRELHFITNSKNPEIPDSYFDKAEKNKKWIDCHEGLTLDVCFSDLQAWADHHLNPDKTLSDINAEQRIGMNAEKLHRLFPETKIIIVIRDQLSILRSAYIHFINSIPSGHRSFDQFLKTPSGACTMKTLFYSKTITEYWNKFGKDNVMIILNERLKSTPEQCLEELCAFLGISNHTYATEAQTPNLGKGVQKAIIKESLDSLRLNSDYIPEFILSGLSKILPAKLDVVSKETKSLLRDTYTEDNLLTQKMTGLPLKNYGYLMKD